MCQFYSPEEIKEKPLQQLTQISSQLYMACWGKTEMSQDCCINTDKAIS
jgi:hypothetical protein